MRGLMAVKYSSPCSMAMAVLMGMDNYIFTHIMSSNVYCIQLARLYRIVQISTVACLLHNIAPHPSCLVSKI